MGIHMTIFEIINAILFAYYNELVFLLILRGKKANGGSRGTCGLIRLASNRRMQQHYEVNITIIKKP
jgi:hypothetical protein